MWLSRYLGIPRVAKDKSIWKVHEERRERKERRLRHALYLWALAVLKDLFVCVLVRKEASASSVQILQHRQESANSSRFHGSIYRSMTVLTIPKTSIEYPINAGPGWFNMIVNTSNTMHDQLQYGKLDDFRKSKQSNISTSLSLCGL